MVSKSEEHGDECRGQQPPFFLAFIEKQTKDEQEYRYRPHIHWSGREWLRSPVERQGLGDLVGVALSGLPEQFHDLGLVRIHGSG